MTAGPRSARAAFAVATAALALLPPAAAIERSFRVYIARGDGIWYEYRSVSLYPADAVVLVTVLAWLTARSLGQRGAGLGRPVTMALGLAALAVAAGLSATAARDPVLAGGIALQLAILAVFCVAAADVVRTRPRPLLASVSVTVFVEAALAAWQAVTQSTAPAGRLLNGWGREFAAGDVGASVAALPGVDRWLRSYGSFPHPNTLGAFLAISLAAVLVVPGLPRRWRAATLLAGVGALTLTLSRSAWLAFGLGAVVWLLSTGRARRAVAERRIPAAAVLVGLLVVAGASSAGARLGRLDAPIERGSFDERAVEYAAALALFRNGPPVGAGNIVIAEQSVAPLGEPAHDAFLIALAEMGIPGLVAWLALFTTLLWSAWTARRDPAARSAPLVAAAVLLPLLLLDHFLWSQPTGRVLLAWLLAAAAGERSTGGYVLEGRRRAQVGGSLA